MLDRKSSLLHCQTKSYTYQCIIHTGCHRICRIHIVRKSLCCRSSRIHTDCCRIHNCCRIHICRHIHICRCIHICRHIHILHSHIHLDLHKRRWLYTQAQHTKPEWLQSSFWLQLVVSFQQERLSFHIQGPNVINCVCSLILILLGMFDWITIKVQLFFSGFYGTRRNIFPCWIQRFFNVMRFLGVAPVMWVAGWSPWLALLQPSLHFKSKCLIKRG